MRKREQRASCHFRARAPMIEAGAPLLCPAPHPARRRRLEFRHQQHGIRLPATFPWPVQETGRILHDFDDIDRAGGCFGVRCTCDAVIEFRVARTEAAA